MSWWSRRDVNAVHLLMSKSVKTLVRKDSHRVLIGASSVLVFGMLYCMWYLSKHQELRFMTSDAYQKLQFNMVCDFDHMSKSDKLSCEPMHHDEKGLTTSDLVFTKLSSGVLLPDSREASKFAALLSSLMMNGLPLLGLDDFVYFSDFISDQIGTTAKKTLLSAPGYKEKFSNFLEVRSNRIILYPDNCWTQQFVEYMKNETKTFQNLNIKIYKNKKKALKSCCHNVWALIQIHETTNYQKNTDLCLIFASNRSNIEYIAIESLIQPQPSITIRMHPAAIPDTRNYEYSPLNRHLLSRQESGQLLYFTSGFLTLQMEIQNFLAHWQLGGTKIQSNVFTGRNGEILLHPVLAAYDVAEKLAQSVSKQQVYDAIFNVTQQQQGARQVLSFPLFHRAFPTHNYKQSLFWHTFGALTSIGLIIYFSLPAAITSGEFSRERASGQLDVLSTLPGVRTVHSQLAWFGCASLWVGVSSVLGLLFFAAVLSHTSFLLPGVTLLLLGLSLCPLSVLLGMVVKTADTVVVAVPTLVFVTLLPGLLYFELAFDVQRTVLGELTLCLLPASAAALILRTVCGYEAINSGVGWTTPAAISDCPMYAYVLMLLFDLILYSALALLGSYYLDREHKQTPLTPNQEHTTVYERMASLCAYLISSAHIFISWLRGDDYYILVPPASSHAHLTEEDIELATMSETARVNLQEQPALTVRSLSKQYRAGVSEVVVLSDINVNLHAQSITLLLGSNGAGKTTLMRLLSGLDKSYSGSVQLQQQQGQRHRDNQRQIGWCPQNDALFELLTVKEHIQLISSIVNNVPCPDFTALLVTEASQWLSWCGCGWASAVGANSSDESINISSSSYSSSASSNSSSDDAAVSGSIQQQRKQREILDRTLDALDLTRHRHKRVSELSGGMKRRLSLSLAFLGEPAVLFLDEPTSGCDSWTRELVRKDILSRRGACAVLISTHHTDDVDVLADRVWFLSDRYLEVDEAVVDLAAWRSSELQRRQTTAQHRPQQTTMQSTVSSTNNVADSTVKLGALGEVAAGCNGGHAIEFSTYDAQVTEKFYAVMGRQRAASWVNYASSGTAVEAQSDPTFPHHSNTDMSTADTCTVWIVPVDCLHLLRGLVAELENAGLMSWSLNTCSTYSTLCHLYDQDRHPALAPSSATTATTAGTALTSSQRRNNNAVAQMFRHVYAVLWMRWLELHSNRLSFLVAQVLLPFLIVFAVAWGCGDVVYPKTEINSRNIDGVGEMCFAEGDPRVFSEGGVQGEVHGARKKNAASRTSMKEQSSAVSEDYTTSLTGTEMSNSSTPLQEALVAQLGADQVSYVGTMGSDDMWQELFDTYYSHTDQRWAAFVVHDLVPQWVKSTVVLRWSALTVDLQVLYEEIERVQRVVCNASTTTQEGHLQSGAHTADGRAPQLPTRFCGSSPALKIEIRNDTSLSNATASHNSTAADKFQYTDLSIAITSYESLRANLTMLSNVTTDHAAPTYLKEVVPVVYSATERAQANASFNATNALLKASYQLFSHPLPLPNRSNDVYMERGYLGSTIVVLYMLMTTIVCVRSVIKQRRNGTKQQLHLASLHPSTYWTANFLWDTALCCITLCAAMCGIIAGGPPISNYFMEFPPLPGVLFLMCIASFSGAVVASSYAAVVLSEDQLASQMLLLVSTVAGGMFLKLYLDRHAREVGYLAVTHLLLHVSPAFTFATAVFDLIAVHALEVSAAAQGKPGPSHSHLLRSVYHCVVIMLVQALGYLALCVCIDVYYVKVAAWVGRVRWYYSTTHSSLCHSATRAPIMVEESDEEDGYRTSLGSTDQLVGSTDRLLVEETGQHRGHYGSIASVSSVSLESSTAGQSMLAMLQQHPDVGIFPVITTGECELLHLRCPNPTVYQVHHSPAVPPTTTPPREQLTVRSDKVTVKYPRHDKLALCGATFQIGRKERVALMGMNGGGKSTLFRTMALVENSPVFGQLQTGGLDSVNNVWEMGPRSVLGYAPQEGGLFEFMTVQHTLQLFKLLRPVRSMSTAAKGTHDIIPSKYFAYPVRTLSGGTRKKLSVCVANTGAPALLMLDECTTGVDPIAAERIVRYLKHAVDSESQALLFASHRIDESLAVCERVLMLVEGQVYLDAPIHCMHDLAHRFYQVDISLSATYTAPLHGGDLSQQDTPLQECGLPLDEEDVGIAMDNVGEFPEQAQQQRKQLQSTAGTSEERLKEFIAELALSVGGRCNLERVVTYSNTLLRITLQRDRVPVTVVWTQLAVWLESDRIRSYAFRSMEMEEVLSTILATAAARAGR